MCFGGTLNSLYLYFFRGANFQLLNKDTIQKEKKTARL